MLKKVYGKKFSRAQKGRRALFRSLVSALALRGKVTTTLAKAKVLDAYFNKLIVKMKRNTLASRRQIFADLGNDKASTAELVKIAAATKRKSGFTKLVKIPNRKGDNALMATVEIIKEEVKKEKKDENIPTKS
jgi:large subunit ribosomal protein L17